jgi:hypothetical protein
MPHEETIPLDTPGEYASGLLARLGDRDPVEVLAAGPAAFRALFEGASDEAVRMPEQPGKWSMLEVMHHLADSDMVSGVRIRMIVAQERPPIAAYDQEAWAEKLRYRDANLDDVLEQFRVLREANVRMLRRLSPDDLRRAGVHSERGAESAGYLLRLVAGHDLVHLAQLERIRAAVSSR